MDKRVATPEWPLSIRLNHWTMIISLIVLTITGFYIAMPFTVIAGDTIEKFLMGNMRTLHILFGVFMTVIFIWRFYLAFFSTFRADWKDFFAWRDFGNAIKQIKFYTFFSKETPEHRYLYGPIQSIAYNAYMIMFTLIVLTGGILMGAGYGGGLTNWLYTIFKPVETLMGGLANVRYLHHLLMWGIILFAILHIYMAFWYDIVFRQGTVSSMISGHLFKKPGELLP